MKEELIGSSTFPSTSPNGNRPFPMILLAFFLFVGLAKSCTIGPSVFGVDLSFLNSANFVDFQEFLTATGNVTRTQLIELLQINMAKRSAAHRYAVDDFILRVEMGKVEAKFELYKLKAVLSAEAMRIAKTIHDIEVNDDLVCDDREKWVESVLHVGTPSAVEDYQRERKQFEQGFRSHRMHWTTASFDETFI